MFMTLHSPRVFNCWYVKSSSINIVLLRGTVSLMM